MDTAEVLQQLADRLAALERHVFEQDKEMLAMSRQLEHLRGGLLGLRERLSDPSSDQCARVGGGAHDDIGGAASHAYDVERPPHY